MFSGVNAWQIAEFKEIGKIKFGELIYYFIHKDAIYMVNFDWLKFGEPQITRQIHQTFPPPNISAIRYTSTHIIIIAKRISMRQIIVFYLRFCMYIYMLNKNSLRLFLFSISLVFASNHSLLKYLYYT